MSTAQPADRFWNPQYVSSFACDTFILPLKSPAINLSNIHIFTQICICNYILKYIYVYIFEYVVLCTHNTNRILMIYRIMCTECISNNHPLIITPIRRWCTQRYVNTLCENYLIFFNYSMQIPACIYRGFNFKSDAQLYQTQGSKRVYAWQADWHNCQTAGTELVTFYKPLSRCRS